MALTPGSSVTAPGASSPCRSRPCAARCTVRPMRVFLINPPTAYDEQTSLLERSGLCYLASVAKAAGRAVALHDMVSTRHADGDRLFERSHGHDERVRALRSRRARGAGALRGRPRWHQSRQA